METIELNHIIYMLSANEVSAIWLSATKDDRYDVLERQLKSYLHQSLTEVELINAVRNIKGLAKSHKMNTDFKTISNTAAMFLEHCSNEQIERIIRNLQSLEVKKFIQSNVIIQRVNALHNYLNFRKGKYMKLTSATKVFQFNGVHSHA